MKDIHKRIARLVLARIEDNGFVLAGGYALSGNGIGDRPSMDLDLFTNQSDPQSFSVACRKTVDILEQSGYHVSLKRSLPSFFEAEITDQETGEKTDLQLAMNYREFPPRRISIGLVLDERDAVGAKMGALYSRHEVRDYIDIDNVIQSGRFTKEQVLALGDSQEVFPLDRVILINVFGMLKENLDTDAFLEYDVTDPQPIVDRFCAWAREIKQELIQDENPPSHNHESNHHGSNGIFL